MRIVESNIGKHVALPLDLYVSFKHIYNLYKKYAQDAYKDNPFHQSAKLMEKEIKKYPELIEGFSDLSLLKKHEELIELILDPLFPEVLQENEIKAASVPFSFTSFKLTSRFEKILDNAGEDYVLNFTNYDDEVLYIMSCTFILNAYYQYGQNADLKRPFFFDIPNQKAGTTRHYRAAFNGDFLDVIKTDAAPEITEEDYKLLIDNFDNYELWREKFPPNSYIMKGFGLMNLFDVTSDHSITSIRTTLLKGRENSLRSELQSHLREFFNISDLKLGYSYFNMDDTHNSKIKFAESLLFDCDSASSCANFFCDGIIDRIFKKNEIVAISDVNAYGEKANKNAFYQQLKKLDIGSIILIPIKSNIEDALAILEIASPRPFELNSLNQNKLIDIIPAFEATIDRSAEEFRNSIEATIQEHYTSLHDAVKWRFVEAAEKYQVAITSGNKNAVPDNIVFDEVYPLFGQTDIKGSSIARNTAIKEDLSIQLNLAIGILKKACKEEKLPIYDELMFRVNQYLAHVKDGLNAGDEIAIIDFLKKDIYPVFTHIRELKNYLSDEVDIYMDRLDPKLQVVYEKRKDYEQSVSLLNDKLASFIDAKQQEAQEMFPHYFERYKTDGVEHNMYIGQSLVHNKKFDDLYLYNLRLWQLQLVCEMENVAHSMRQHIPHDLRVASLILVHSNPLAIRFRMDEKQFDVDGAYNIRYEIIKKRIDKAHIKDTNERLTAPGKIAIVYSQDKNANEYMKYLNYLQSKKVIGEVEHLEIEELQGVSGLKALRAEVIYQKDFDIQDAITLSDLIKELEAN